jgi:hypothetical protein
VAALALVIGLAVALTGGSSEPVWINITPAKASVQVDGQAVKNSEVANLALGDHQLTATAPGFRPLKRRLTVSKRTPPVTDFLSAADGADPASPAPPARPFPTPPPPGPATGAATGTPPAPGTTVAAKDPAPVTTPPPTGAASTPTTPAAPKTFVAIFETEEPDIEISIGGKSLGKTPGLRLPGMAVGKDYSYLAKKAGFKSAPGKFRSDGQPEITIPLSMEKIAPPPATGTATVTNTGTGTAPPPPKKLERGELACASKPQGAQIFLDGRATGRTTPAPPSNPIRLFTGKHKVTFKLNGKSVDRTVDIKAGQMEMVRDVEL